MEFYRRQKCIYLFAGFLFVRHVTSQRSSDGDPVFSACGGDITTDRGIITSPNYPENYPNNLICTWTINTQANVDVEISFDVVSLERSINCQYDYLAVQFNGGSEQKVCGNTAETNPMQGPMPATLEFKSDASVGRRGFSLTFQDLHPLQISFGVIKMEVAANCIDYLAVKFNGGTEQRICVNSSKTNPLRGRLPVELVFHSDSSITRTGFSLTFKVISPCLSNPCQNGATCNYGTDIYTCACADGWEGVNCETNINECLSTPCQNGGTCSDDVNSFSCTCPRGYSGPTCDITIDYCFLNSPCRNGGTCTNNNQSYVCGCLAGYTGSNCETNIDECLSAPCQNGGTCFDDINSFSCTCARGYSGSTCDVIIDYCFLNSPCINGGTCTNNNQSYVCGCLAGYTGPNCEINVNECLSAPCQNGGTCSDDVNSFVCTCARGYSGSTCDVIIDYCFLNSPCMNGGTCTNNNQSYVCGCLAGYTGSNCETNVNECLSTPCQNRGTCSDDINSFFCTCARGYSGSTCDVIIDYCFLNSPCMNGGTCTNNNQSYVCGCLAGYTGTNCETDTDDCDSNPCMNGGTCEDRLNQYVCACAVRFSGTNCEIVTTTTQVTIPSTTATTQRSSAEEAIARRCSDFECLNGGSCVVMNQITEACLCLKGFEGERCQNDVIYTSYFIAMIVAIMVSSICLLLLATILCCFVYKRNATNIVEAINLPQQGNPGSEKSTKPNGNPSDLQRNKITRRNTEPKDIKPVTVSGREDVDFALPHQVKENGTFGNPSYFHTLPKSIPRRNENISLDTLLSVCNILQSKSSRSLPGTNTLSDITSPPNAMSALLKQFSQPLDVAFPESKDRNFPQAKKPLSSQAIEEKLPKIIPKLEDEQKSSHSDKVPKFKYFNYVDQYEDANKGKAFASLTRENAFICE